MDAGDETYGVEIKDITLTPSFPEPGKELLIEAEGTVKDAILDGAIVQVTVKLGLVTLIRKTFDLCEEMEKNDVLNCPVEKGDIKVRAAPSSHGHHVVFQIFILLPTPRRYIHRSSSPLNCQRKFQR